MKRAGKRFDAENEVVTEALIFLGDLDPEAIGDALRDATHYEPTPVADFDRLLRAAAADVRDMTFVDVGAGLGRALMLASLHPFKQIVGIEVSRALCETARDNLVRRRQKRGTPACSDIRVVCRSADTFRMPRGRLLFYLFNPFGAASMHRFLQRVKCECEGGTLLIYHTPVERSVFEHDVAFERIAEIDAGAIFRLR